MQLKFWDRIYLSPDFEIIIFFSSIALLVLVISILNLYINWNKTRRFIKITEPFKKLSTKETKELAMSIFEKARTQADEDLSNSAASGNESLMINVLSNAMVALDRQGEGLAELMQVASVARGVIKAGKSLDEIVIDAKNRIHSLKGDFDEQSKENLISALDNDPEAFFKEMLDKTPSQISESSIPDHNEEQSLSDLSQDNDDIDQKNDEKFSSVEVRSLIKNEELYPALKRRLNGGEWAVLADWVFEGEGKIIPPSQFMIIYAFFKEKSAHGNCTTEEKKIFEYLKSQKEIRNIS